VSYVHTLLHTPTQRYAIGSVLSWPIYVGLLLLAESIGMWPIASATIAWMLSYVCVYGMQRDSAHRSVREFVLYSLVVIAPSALVNFGLLELMQTHTKVAEMPALLIAALLAGLIGYLGSRIALK
jgi:putative flippase GtrA